MKYSNKPCKERTDFLIKLLENSKAEIIGLQEVIPKFLRKLLNQQWVKDSYYLTEITGNSFCGYGNIIMTSLRPSCFYTIPLESFMGRQLIVAEFIVTTRSGSLETLRVGVVHLESLASNHELRAYQCKQIFPFLSLPDQQTKRVHAVLMGDFNYDPKSKEEENVTAVPEQPFLDCWHSANPDDDGPTRYVNYPEENKHPVRLDRILLHSPNARVHPISCVTLGSECVPMESKNPEYQVVYPSDHLGLLCHLQVLRKNR